MSSEDTIIQDDLTRLGLRRLHVMRMGEPVKVESHILRVPLPSIHTLVETEWEEKDLGMFHLLLCWKVREVVKIHAQGTDREVVAWWIDMEAGDTIRKAADDACCYFSAMFTWLPTVAAVSKIPAKQEKKTGWLDEPFQDVNFVEEPWVPKGCVMVW